MTSSVWTIVSSIFWEKPLSFSFSELVILWILELIGCCLSSDPRSKRIDWLVALTKGTRRSNCSSWEKGNDQHKKRYRVLKKKVFLAVRGFVLREIERSIRIEGLLAGSVYSQRDGNRERQKEEEERCSDWKKIDPCCNRECIYTGAATKEREHNNRHGKERR